MSTGQQEQAVLRTVQLKAQDITPEAFAPYGQVVGPSEDGEPYGPGDACLSLDGGQPRFYIMRLPHRGRCFERITFHGGCTQCLGALAPAQPWFLVVAAPSGSVQRRPAKQDLAAFRIPHGVFVKLERGVWHAGPLFDSASQDFYNLELADTNVVDHNTWHYARDEGLRFEVVD